jgi:hypothetical protein
MLKHPVNKSSATGQGGSERSFQASKDSVLESKVQAGFCQTSMAWTERRD